MQDWDWKLVATLSGLAGSAIGWLLSHTMQAGREKRAQRVAAYSDWAVAVADVFTTNRGGESVAALRRATARVAVVGRRDVVYKTLDGFEDALLARDPYARPVMTAIAWMNTDALSYRDRSFGKLQKWDLAEACLAQLLVTTSRCRNATQSTDQ